MHHTYSSEQLPGHGCSGEPPYSTKSARRSEDSPGARRPSPSPQTSLFQGLREPPSAPNGSHASRPLAITAPIQPAPTSLIQSQLCIPVRVAKSLIPLPCSSSEPDRTVKRPLSHSQRSPVRVRSAMGCGSFLSDNWQMLQLYLCNADASHRRRVIDSNQLRARYPGYEGSCKHARH